MWNASTSSTCSTALRDGRPRRSWIIVAGFAVAVLWPATLHAQGDGEAPFLPKALRYDEDYRYLADPAKRGARWDPLKYIPLNEAGGTYLSLGGEWRERVEFTRHPGFGLVPFTRDGVLLHRLLLSADLHVGAGFRAFVQVGAYDQTGRKGRPLATDENRLDAQQAFFDVSGGVGEAGRATLRIGRQVMVYGSGRLVSIREGPNARRSFDGFRGLYRSAGLTVDAFVTRPVRLRPGTFNDRPDTDQAFWGVYAVTRLPGDANVDLYYFGLKQASTRYESGIGDERRHTVGTRLWGALDRFDYNVEFLYQFGRFAAQTISAWGASADVGVTVAHWPFTPRLGFKANLESGDRDPRDRRLGTLNPLFPNHAYFSEAALAAPMNDMDIQANVTLQLADRLSLVIAWDVFWRHRKQDAVYSAILRPIPGTAGGGSRYVGSMLTSHARWRFDRHFEFNLDYTRFFAGQTIRKAGGRDVDFAMASVAYRF